MDDDEARLKPVLVGLAALAGVSVIVGVLVSLVALGVANVAGLGGGDEPSEASSEESSLYIPSPSATRKPAARPSKGPGRPDEAETTKEAAERQITLVASPTSVASSERIDLRGTYRNVDSATLQVQRLDGGWTDFPVTATVSGGTFATWVQTGVSGRNRFRVVDKSTGRSSEPVSVDVD